MVIIDKNALVGLSEYFLAWCLDEKSLYLSDASYEMLRVVVNV